MKNNELYHYGILGMRWGHRKTQPTTGGSITKNGKYKASNAARKTRKADKKEYKNDVKNLRKTLRVGDVNLYDDKGFLVGRANATTVVHNEIATRKGKDYADRVLKKARNQTYAKIAGSAVALVGASIAFEMLGD